MQEDNLHELISSFKAHSSLALARLCSIIQNSPEKCPEIFSALKLDNSRSIIIGITGAPGAGKSTLINQLLCFYREKFERIAVLAIDPSSEISGGAFLGDRERMKQHAMDNKIFIRSIANRGQLGGLTAEIYDLMLLLRAFQFDLILVETVGVGQTEIEVSKIADLTAVVLTPSFGDDFQLLKAGILEIADIYVINKSDLPGSDRFIAALRALADRPRNKEVPIVSIQAFSGDGIENLIINLEMVYEDLCTNDELEIRKQKRLRGHIRHILDRQIEAKVHRLSEKSSWQELSAILNPYEILPMIERTGLQND